MADTPGNTTQAPFRALDKMSEKQVQVVVSLGVTYVIEGEKNISTTESHQESRLSNARTNMQNAARTQEEGVSTKHATEKDTKFERLQQLLWAGQPYVASAHSSARHPTNNIMKRA